MSPDSVAYGAGFVIVYFGALIWAQLRSRRNPTRAPRPLRGRRGGGLDR